MAHTAEAFLGQQYEDLERQHDTATFGMWIFLASEVLFFGGLFGAYTAYRFVYPHVFAEASSHLNIALGSINTAVLLCSSLTMALAVHFAQIGQRKLLIGFLLATMLLGTVFLGIKGTEWYLEYREGLLPGNTFAYVSPDPTNVPATSVELFMVLYFVMTGLHATHMIVGLGIMAGLVYFAWRGRYSEDYFSPIEITGLYWHFVDIVWIFLFPLLYLIGHA